MRIDPAFINHMKQIGNNSGNAMGNVGGASKTDALKTLEGIVSTKDLSQVDFAEALDKAMSVVNQSDFDSKRVGDLLAIGEIENPHDVTIAATKAELTLNYAIEVKNRVIESYREIMRLQL